MNRFFISKQWCWKN